ncbi:MAG TPA: UPF0182 family protein [Firmicutes bacterium]|nr:UPF0182 family protein [Bacillota bacterium]
MFDIGERTRASLLLLGVVLGGLLVVAVVGAYGYTELLWFRHLGYGQVLLQVWWSRLWVGLLIGVLYTLFLSLNLHWAQRHRQPVVQEAWGLPPLPPRFGMLVVVAGLGVGFVAGVSVSSQWPTVLSFLKQVPFALSDPLFGRDVAFYVFGIPFFRLIVSLLSSLIIITAVGVALIYFFTGGLVAGGGRFSLGRPAKLHLSLLVALYLLVKAGSYWLDRFSLMFSPRGSVFGAGYADVHAVLPALTGLMVLAAVAAVVIAATARSRDLRPLWVPVAVLVAVSLVGGTLYPAAVQQFTVNPNELQKEKPFIANNITFTRRAYGLDGIREEPFVPKDSLTYRELAATPEIVDNIRLWDYRPLQQTYAQLQEIRLYYTFPDADVDRYQVNGRYRQVLLGVRELNQDNLPAEARTWINERLKYTHGYGIVMSPANRFTTEGMPEFFIKDIPPASSVDIQVTEPRIYFGELTNQWVVVKSGEKEFDYPRGDENEWYTYQGQGGIPIGNWLNRLAFAIRLESYQLLFSGAVTPDSRVMLYRNIGQRARRIAPFLRYDRDPYPVINDGRIFWILDAYTTSSHFPYSMPSREGFNYVRNAVKVVVDAFNGDITFYLFDPEDPIARTYARVFPALFKPAAEMPEGLKAHVRYPVDLFRWQAQMYTAYHMQEPFVFYNREDQWNIATEIFGTETVEMEPYYLMTELDPQVGPEYILLLPYTPNEKRNMIAWLAARCDGPHYGQLVVYKFPKESLVFGPMQIEARIDQDARISQDLALWGAKGLVFRGNLLVIPVKDSVLYVEPLYLQSKETKLPELKRVVVGYGNVVAMESTLEGALRAATAGTTAPPAPAETLTVAQLVARARELYLQAEQRVKAGDWAGYGQTIRELGDVLQRLQTMTGGRLPLEQAGP